MRLVSSCLTILLIPIAIILILGSRDKYVPPPEPTPVPRECNEELIRLAEEVLSNGKMREKNIKRLRELDPSDEMTIAIELMDDKRLRKIVKETQNACRIDQN